MRIPTIFYSNREYYQRNYSYSDNGSTTTKGLRIDADANALYDQAYNTSGTDSSLNPTTLEQREILDYIEHNANLNDTTEEYQILNRGEPLYY